MSRVRGWLVVLASVSLLVGCTPASDPPDAAELPAFAAKNAQLLGLEHVSLEPEGADQAHITWQIPGLDPGISTIDAAVTWRGHGDERELVAVEPGQSASPLWLTEPLEVRAAPGVLVFGAPAQVDRVLRDAEVARRHVLNAMPAWDGKLVVEVPSTLGVLTNALNGRPDEFDAVAATTSSSDGSRDADAPIHVFVNPEEYDAMGAAASRIVMTHEVVHVATKSPTVRVPLWWSEGLADYVAFSEVDGRDAGSARRLLRASQQRLATAVAERGVPDDLPGEREFADDPTSAYESARLACQILTETVGGQGQAALLRLQGLLADGVDEQEAIPLIFKISHREFVNRWQRRLADERLSHVG